MNVALHSVNAFTRQTHVNRVFETREAHTYEVQETDGVDPSSFSERSQATAGDGCPGVVTMNRLRVAATTR
jgi:hypothetical protein